MQSPSRAALLRHGGALAAVILATAARLALDPVLGDLFPLATLFLAVLVVAWYAGGGPALLATVLGAFVAARVLLPPRDSFAVLGVENRSGLVLYLAVGAGISLLGGALRDARRRAEGVVDLALPPIKDEAGRVVFLAPIGTDITDRDRAEERARFQAHLLDAVGQAVIVTDPGGRIIYSNRFAETLYGWGADEATGRGILEIVVAKELAGRAEEIMASMRAGEGWSGEFTARRRDGTTFPAFVTDTPVFDERGSLRAIIGVSMDITERKRAEEALRERERFTQRILDASPGIVYVFDLEDRRTVFINERARATIGMAPGAVEAAGGRFMAERVHPDDLPGLEEHLGRLSTLADGDVMATEYRLRHADGRWLWFAGRDTVFQRAPDGRPRQVLGVASEITDRKEAEGRARDGEERYRTMAESIPQLAWMARPDGHIYWYNRRWHEYTGMTPEEMEGWGWRKVHDPDVLPRVLERWQGSIASGEPFDMVFPLKGADGQYRPFLTRVMPVRGEDGRVAHWFGTNTDIAERHRIEDELKVAKEEAEAANRAKTQFLAVLSHELRTPLNPILLAASSMLDRPGDPEEIRPTLEMIRQNVNLQARLIDDLLDVMRIVQGKMPLHWEVADCHRCIDQAVKICQSEVSGHDLRLTVEAVARHHHVNADSARLQQVFWNLIKNAVKFTPEGGTITVRTRDEADPGGAEGRIVVEVSDTGIGIEPDILPTIWDPFQQGETTITRKFGGLGLGLAICKGVVEAHGGLLEAESPGKGRGTTFRVVLKALPEQAVVGDGEPAGGVLEVAPSRPSPLRVLVVEDEPATLRLMARLLRGLGHAVTTAGTIALAYEAFEAGEFDLIVSDIGLPDGTGLELMRRAVALRGRTPSIALTGYGMEDDIVRSREAGFTTHMTKPIDFTKLEAMIRQVVTDDAH